MNMNPWTSRRRNIQPSSGSSGQDELPQEAGGSGRGSYAEQFRAAAPADSVDQSDAEDSGWQDHTSSYQYQFMGGESPPRTDPTTAAETTTARKEEAAPAMTAEPSPNEGELRQKLEERRAATAEENLPVLPKKALRKLNTNFRELSLVEGNLRELDRSLCTIYCTSSFEKEGKTTAATSIAFGLSEFNNCSVLLVDTNYEKPQLDRLLGIPGSPGLQELLANTVSPAETILPTGYQHLYLLPAGEGAASVANSRFADLLSEFKANFDFVVIDGKTLFASSEVDNLAPMIDGFLVVVECEKTKWEVVQIAQNKLSNAGAADAGVMLNQRRFYLPNFIYRLVSRS